MYNPSDSLLAFLPFLPSTLLDSQPATNLEPAQEARYRLKLRFDATDWSDRIVQPWKKLSDPIFFSTRTFSDTVEWWLWLADQAKKLQPSPNLRNHFPSPSPCNVQASAMIPSWNIILYTFIQYHWYGLQLHMSRTAGGIPKRIQTLQHIRGKTQRKTGVQQKTPESVRSRDWDFRILSKGRRDKMGEQN
jgi:hypothetical protein